MRKPRPCRDCGKPLSANSAKHVIRCGRCATKRMQLGAAGWNYSRVHVHYWDDGSRTIEDGVRCDGSDHGRGAA